MGRVVFKVIFWRYFCIFLRLVWMLVGSLRFFEGGLEKRGVMWLDWGWGRWALGGKEKKGEREKKQLRFFFLREGKKYQFCFEYG